MKAEYYLNAISFLSRQFKNYKPDKAILYKKKSALLCSPSDCYPINREQDFYGCTLYDYMSETVAIIDCDFFEDGSEISAVLVHELFHVYQAKNWLMQDINGRYFN